MRILVNATTLLKGGAVQVAYALIAEALQDPRTADWSFAVSHAVANNLQRLPAWRNRPKHIFDHSPARSLKLRAELRRLEGTIHPDGVFTVFGPTFTRFRAPHLMGCAQGWVTHPSAVAYRTLGPMHIQWLRRAHCLYLAWWFRAADRWVSESETSQHGMHCRLGIPLEKIALISNTCAQPYLEQAGRTPFPERGETLRLFCFAASYPHKCLEMIPDVAAALVRRCPRLSFEFVLTLPADDAAWLRIEARAQRLAVRQHIRNIGPVAVADGPSVYRSCHVCFLPTVLETFSATYPEAMAMGLPIVTSDLDFARDLCQDSAVFFRPCDAEDAARAVADLVENPRQWNTLIDRGKQVLRTFPTPRQKYEAYYRLLEELVVGPPASTELRRAA